MKVDVPRPASHHRIAAVDWQDVGALAALPALWAAAWLLPERQWSGLCRFIAPRDDRGPPRLAAHRLEHHLQYLRELTPAGWRPRLTLEGRRHIDEARKAGRGVILWVGHFAFNGLAAKKALHGAGYQAAHVSRPEHGLSASRLGRLTFNAAIARIENRYLGERLVVERGYEAGAMRRAHAILAGGGIISITAGAWEGLKINRVPFLGGQLPLATGAPALAHATGATLLPLFTVRRAPGAPIRTIIEAPIIIAADETRSRAIAGANQAYVQRLEPHVLAHPDQWRGWHYLGPGAEPHAFTAQDGDVPLSDHPALAAED